MQMSLIIIGWPVTQLTYQTPWKPSPWWDLSSMVTKGDSRQERYKHRQRKVVQHWQQFVLLLCSEAHQQAQRLTEEESVMLTAGCYLTTSRGHKLIIIRVSRLTQNQQLSRYHPSSLFPWSSASAGGRSRFTQLLPPGEAPPPLSRWSCSHILNIWSFKTGLWCHHNVEREGMKKKTTFSTGTGERVSPTTSCSTVVLLLPAMSLSANQHTTRSEYR